MGAVIASSATSMCPLERILTQGVSRAGLGPVLRPNPTCGSWTHGDMEQASKQACLRCDASRLSHSQQTEAAHSPKQAIYFNDHSFTILTAATAAAEIKLGYDAVDESQIFIKQRNCFLG
eukprot:667591-Pyramimonas_sp.AAC.1